MGLPTNAPPLIRLLQPANERVQEKIQKLCQISLNAGEKQFQSSSHSFIYQETSVESQNNLFIRSSNAIAHALQCGGSRLYIAFERRKP